MSKKYKKIRSREEKIFRFLVVLLILAIAALWYLKVDTYLNQKNMDEQKVVLAEQEEELSQYKNVTSYDKFLLINDLEEKSVDMPRFEHIPKILAIFEDLKNLDSSSSDTIILSDFKVSLDSISLKGTVSSLRALYYNSPTGKFKSLLDRFEWLDFIEDMTIKSYEKVGEKYFEFVLDAKVVNNDTK